MKRKGNNMKTKYQIRVCDRVLNEYNTYYEADMFFQKLWAIISKLPGQDIYKGTDLDISITEASYFIDSEGLEWDCDESGRAI